MQNNEQAQPNNDSRCIRTESELSPKEFQDFIDFLGMIRADFDDFSLVNGAFRAYSNEHKCIVETGFCFFRDMNFNLSDIKTFIRKISTFKKSKRIILNVDDSFITLADENGSLQIPNINSKRILNKFISDKEMMNTILKNVDPNKIIFGETIPIQSILRINKTSRILRTNNIIFKHDKNVLNKGVLSIPGNETDSPECVVELKNKLFIPLKRNYCFKLAMSPSLFKKDDVYIKSYFNHDQSVCTMYNTKINDIYVNIYSHSEMMHICYSKYDI